LQAEGQWKKFMGTPKIMMKAGLGHQKLPDGSKAAIFKIKVLRGNHGVKQKCFLSQAGK